MAKFVHAPLTEKEKADTQAWIDAHDDLKRGGPMAKKKAAPAPKPAKKTAPAKAPAAPKVEKQTKDQVQDKRDVLIVASYSRTLKQLASIYGGTFAAENARLADELKALEG